ncbi:uracil-DNA glycosylase family protein, partial [Phenylobacterium sp.]|uniref:uracil-DNA glycosylase family protein n=1 Tax=Phenylobacterium sp. TaxID=1871053 RepID=UPI0025E21FCC
MSRPPVAVAESLLAFWAEAGVDAALLETPVDRIAEGQIARPPRAPVQISPEPGPRATRSQPIALDAARQIALACQDLEALASAIASFEGCPLRFEGAASRAVFSRGRADADVVVIGEAPGAEEDRTGLPFVGKAGKMLD